MENMLRLAQDVQGEFIRNQMIMAVIDRLIEIDVSSVVFLTFPEIKYFPELA